MADQQPSNEKLDNILAILGGFDKGLKDLNAQVAEQKRDMAMLQGKLESMKQNEKKIEEMAGDGDSDDGLVLSESGKDKAGLGESIVNSAKDAMPVPPNSGN